MAPENMHRRSRWRPLLWFAGLYLSALLIYGAITFLLHLAIWR
ncbi:MAG: hypothetical protein WCC11_10800 [Gammaproteobacteria bacterium]